MDRHISLSGLSILPTFSNPLFRHQIIYDGTLLIKMSYCKADGYRTLVGV